MNESIPPIASSIPTGTIGRGPTLISSTRVVRLAARTIATTIGRNASPVSTGEKPRVCCM